MADNFVRVAVVGCAHGELDKINASVTEFNEQNERKVDLLICCGDFQAVRNYSDLKCMAVPPKYQQLQTFHSYYSGQRQCPVLTLFVGGNHEASNFLSELPLGGWVAKDIFYMGLAVVVRFKGLRIAGLSGIFKGRQHQRGHFECPPYDEDTKRSVYHIRNLEVYRCKQLKTNNGESAVDIMVTHDWPRGISEYGDKNRLYKLKPHFRDEGERGQLGNPATAHLLGELKPRHWFSAHLHVKFEATVKHSDNLETKFLALDKPTDNKRRIYMEIVDIETRGDWNEELSYDTEWLTVLRNTDHLVNLRNTGSYMPGPGGCSGERFDFKPTESELSATVSLFPSGLQIPSNFLPTAPFHSSTDNKRNATQSKYYRNPQTAQLCEKLGITDWNFELCEKNPHNVGRALETESGTEKAPEESAKNPEEISLDEEEEDDDLFGHFSDTQTFVPPPIKRVAEKDHESEAGNAVPKMKRRNQEMYTASVDDP